MKLKDFMAAMQAIETDRKLSKEVGCGCPAGSSGKGIP